ncbi:hypothetical protein [Vibrio sp. R78045]|uniref:hypothetical protein n=1 Tax=Vibrio sp. R78045 TaxID=3093868 RepID=UPI0036F27AC9
MWTEKEKEFLMKNAGKLSTKEMSKKLKKKPDCIRQTACILGVSLHIEKIDPDVKKQMLKMLKSGLPKLKISKVTGVSLSTVRAYAKNPNKCNKPKRNNNGKRPKSVVHDKTTSNLVNAVFSL